MNELLPEAGRAAGNQPGQLCHTDAVEERRSIPSSFKYASVVSDEGLSLVGLPRFGKDRGEVGSKEHDLFPKSQIAGYTSLGCNYAHYE